MGQAKAGIIFQIKLPLIYSTGVEDHLILQRDNTTHNQQGLVKSTDDVPQLGCDNPIFC